MADVAAARAAIRDAGAQVAFVHGGSAAEADAWFAKYGLDDVIRVSDPALAHYRAFGLGRTRLQALVDPQVWARGAVCALSHGFGAQTPEMMRQLPGVFVVQGDRMLAEYRHRSPADRPDYLAPRPLGEPRTIAYATCSPTCVETDPLILSSGGFMTARRLWQWCWCSRWRHRAAAFAQTGTQQPPPQPPTPNPPKNRPSTKNRSSSRRRRSSSSSSTRRRRCRS